MPQDAQFIITFHKEKQQILTTEMMEYAWNRI